MLVVMGLTGTGTRGEVHPAAGRHRLHQRHRAGDRQHAAEGLPRPGGRRARRVHRPDPGARREPGRRVARTASLLGAGTLLVLIVWSRFVKRVPAYIVALFAGTVGRGRAAARRRDHRIAVRRHSVRPAALSGPGVPSRADPDAALAGVDGRDARRDRVADVGGGRRPHGRRSPQSQRRAVRPGHRQHRVAAVRRPAGDRRDRAHGDQHPIGRANAGGRHDPRADAAACCCSAPLGCRTCRWRCSPRSCSSSPTTWASGARSASSSSRPRPTRRVAGDVRADGARRSDGRGRGRHDPGGVALHPPRDADDDGDRA